jgi:hypothetical protein
MSKNNCLRPPLFAGLLLAACFAAQAAHASTIVVGTCKAGIQFSTIAAAILAAPPGATVNVCAGSYGEQLTITKNLTLKGIAAGNSDAAILVSPSGGLVQNATTLSGAGVEAQIYVQGAAVNISNLTVDAANNNLDSLGCNADPIGIYYQNSSGTITRNSILNDILDSPDLIGCQSGLGFYAENSGPGATLTITYNNVENYQKNGITVNGPGIIGTAGAAATISFNTVIGQGPWTGAAQNSIQLGFGATGKIASNTVGSDVWAPDVFGDVGNAAAGILVYASSGVSITSNNVSQTQYGITVDSDTNYGSADSSQITKNTVSTTHLYDGIDLCSNNNTAAGNTVNGSDEAGIHIDATCTGSSTGNSVTTNTINSACAGVLSGTAGNTTSPNTYYNTVKEVVTGTDVCTPAPTKAPTKGAAKSHGKFSPVKP